MLAAGGDGGIVTCPPPVERRPTDGRAGVRGPAASSAVGRRPLGFLDLAGEGAHAVQQVDHPLRVGEEGRTAGQQRRTAGSLTTAIGPSGGPSQTVTDVAASVANAAAVPCGSGSSSGTATKRTGETRDPRRAPAVCRACRRSAVPAHGGPVPPLPSALRGTCASDELRSRASCPAVLDHSDDQAGCDAADDPDQGLHVGLIGIRRLRLKASDLPPRRARARRRQ
jgi:hypothetical protein